MAKPAPGKAQKLSRKEIFRQQRLQQKRRERIILISAVTVVVLIVAAILIIPNLPANPDNYERPGTIVRTRQDGLTLGDPNAPVKVVEYSDFKCSHCADFWKTQAPGVLSDYIETGKVYFTYHPTSFISEESYNAAEAAYCANDQGKFWEYHDYVFANFGAILTDPLLRAFAKDIDLDMNEFDSCYKQGKYRQQVVDDLTSAQKNGIGSTPTFDVNGTIVDRGVVVDQIEQALAQ